MVPYVFSLISGFASITEKYKLMRHVVCGKLEDKAIYDYIVHMSAIPTVCI